jgi:hypothetical protein
LLAVPSGDSSALQQAIDDAQGGDVIELASGSYPSPGALGFEIRNKGVSFTIRSVSGDPTDVVLDGEHKRPVFRFENDMLELGDFVTFEGITFANGSSEAEGTAGGMTMLKAQGVFRDVVFEGNESNLTLSVQTGGGGTIVGDGSTASFEHCIWRNNANNFFGGGLALEKGSYALIADSLFEDNSTNRQGHFEQAAGAGIHVGDSTLSVQGTPRFGRVLQLLDQGESPNRHADVLRELVWTLAIRTRALRKQFAKTADNLLARLVASASSTAARGVLARHFQSQFDELMDRFVADLPPAKQAVARGVLGLPAVREQLIGLGVEYLHSPDSQALLANLVEVVRAQDRLSRSATDGQIRGLAQLLGQRRAPESFAPSDWSIEAVAPRRLVLGDGCVVACSDAGEATSLLRVSQTWRSIYLPISPSTLLVGARSSAGAELQLEDMNRLSAELSWSHIYSSQADELERGLAERISSGAFILTEDELSELVAGAWSNLERNKDG